MLDRLFKDPRLNKLDRSGRDLVLSFAEGLAANSGGGNMVAKDAAFRAFIERAAPTLADVHVSTELTNLSIAYIQERSQFLAGGQGVFGVTKEAGFYTEYDRGDFFRITPDDAIRAPSTESAGDGFKVKQTSAYQVQVYSIHKDVDEQLMAQQAVGDPVDDAVAYVTQLLLILREIVWGNKIMTTGWGLDRAGVASGPTGDEFIQWNEAASSPRRDIGGEAVRIHSKTGFWPNTFIVQPFVLLELLLHADIVDAFKHTTAGATPTMDALAATLVPPAIDGGAPPKMAVAGGVKTTSAEGATDAFDYIIGKQALLAFVNPSPGLRSPTAWINFAWTGLLGGNAFGFRFKDLEDQLKAIPHRIEGDAAFDIKRVAPELGTFFDTAVA